MSGDLNQTISLSEALDMQDEVFELDPIVQAARFGATNQHITRVGDFSSGKTTKYLYKEQYSGARVTDTINADAHSAGQIDIQKIEIQETDLRRIGFPLVRDLIESALVDGSEHALFNLARELVLQGEESVGEKENILLNSNGDCVLGYVTKVYAAAGTAYSQAASAFIKVTGSISAFKPGMYIHIRGGSTNTDLQVLAKVNDVCYDEYFMGYNIGPGIVCTITTDGVGADGTDSNFDTIDATANSTPNTDEICMSGEADDNFPAAFGALCGTGSYFGITRTTAGNAYLIPTIRHWDSAGTGLGTPTAFSTNSHLIPMVKTFGRMLSSARQYRRNRGFMLTDAIVCQVHPDLLLSMVADFGDSNSRFNMKMASDFDTATRTKLVAVAGWDGGVLRTPLDVMPAIALQAEPLMPAGTFRLFEPSCMEVIRLKGKKLQYVPNAAGGYWHNMQNQTTAGTTGSRLSMQVTAFGYVVETFFCDQPRLVYQADGLS